MSRKSRKRNSKKSSEDQSDNSDSKDLNESESTASAAADSQGESTAEFFMSGTGEDEVEETGPQDQDNDDAEADDVEESDASVDEEDTDDDLDEEDTDDETEDKDDSDSTGIDDFDSEQQEDLEDEEDLELDETETVEAANEDIESDQEADVELESTTQTSTTRVEPKPAPKGTGGVVDASVPVVGAAAAASQGGPVRDSRGSFFDRWFASDNGKRLRARKVRRVIRHIDPWSVLTFSVIFHLVVVGSIFIATLLVFVLSVQLNLLEQVETQIQQLFNLEVFEIRLRPLATALAQFSFILVILGTLLHVLFAVIFNLISDLVGGIRVTVVEEELSTTSRDSR